MKPYPFVGLNHLTVPVATARSIECCPGHIAGLRNLALRVSCATKNEPVRCPECPLLALSRHSLLRCTCPLSGQSRHSLLRRKCLLLTQSGHHITSVAWTPTYRHPSLSKFSV